MKKIFCYSVTLLLAAFSLSPQTEAEEYILKAAFIFNFTKFIDWNATDTDDEFIIGIIGSAAIVPPLSEIAATKTVNGKKIKILHFEKPEDIVHCQILFISRNNYYPLGDILSKVPRGTLTISEKQGSALRGTAINFITVNNKLKFEANIKAIDSAGLTASSQLLKLAVIVD
ncbi:MAG TPA: YfiR family protein [Chitinophagales bacterium]|nr:YfiR family protein [Chitinophagales bacterium]